MNILHFLGTAWSFEPWVFLFALALLCAYAVLPGFRLNGKALVYTSGVTLMVLALVSPLDYLGRNYLFSAHMIEHILLLLIVPVMLVSGIPESAAEKALKVPVLGSIIRFLSNPAPAWLLGVGSMWIWHMPFLQTAAIRNESLYITQQISFVFMGLMFWWPVFSPVKSERLSLLASTLYLASACLGCTVLGMLITFAGAGLYPIYASPVDTAGILPYLRNDLCISPGIDQQIGGLTMWVPGCLIYLTASLVTIAKWYATPESDQLASPGATSAAAKAGIYDRDLKIR